MEGGEECLELSGLKTSRKSKRKRLKDSSGLETAALMKRQEIELEVAEMNLFRCSLGVTRMDRKKDKLIRGTARVRRLGDEVRD